MIEVNGKAIQSALREKPLKRKAVPIELFKLWAVLGEIYGSKFFSAYGDSPTVGWQLCFAGFAPEKIEHGLKNLVESPVFQEWPPTAKQFRELCLQTQDPASQKHPLLEHKFEPTDEERQYGLKILEKLKSNFKSRDA